MLSESLLVVQLALGIIFLLSAAGKLHDPKGFARGVANYRVLPPFLAYHLGFLLIALEACLAIAHLTGRLLGVAVLLGFGTLTSFAAAVGVNLRRGRLLPCYCFGSRGGEAISLRTLVRVLLLAAAELLLLVQPGLFTRSQIIYPGKIESPSQLGLAFSWATFVLVLGAWLLVLPDFVDVIHHERRVSVGLQS